MAQLSTITLVNPSECVVRDYGARSLTFFVKELPVIINKELINELKQVASDNGNVTARVCLHSDSNQIHQDMIILQHEGSYHPPHKHPGKAETFSVLEGVLGIVCYDENGEVVDARRVEEGEIYRAAIHHYHLIMELTPIVIFHESKPGPFLGKEDTMIADWAPSLDDKFAVEQLMRKARDLLI